MGSGTSAPFGQSFDGSERRTGSVPGYPTSKRETLVLTSSSQLVFEPASDPKSSSSALEWRGREAKGRCSRTREELGRRLELDVELETDDCAPGRPQDERRPHSTAGGGQATGAWWAFGGERWGGSQSELWSIMSLV